LKFQWFQPFLSTLFVHPVSCFKKDITAVTVQISTITAVFINAFCPISLFLLYKSGQSYKPGSVLNDHLSRLAVAGKL